MNVRIVVYETDSIGNELIADIIDTELVFRKDGCLSKFHSQMLKKVLQDIGIWERESNRCTKCAGRLPEKRMSIHMIP